MASLTPPPRSRVVVVVVSALLIAVGIALIVLVASTISIFALVGGVVVLGGVYGIVIAVVGPRHVSTSLTLTVGDAERHEVTLTWDQWFGWVRVLVDGRVVSESLRTFSASLVAHWEFPVGEREVHTVRLEKHRPVLVAAARVQPLIAYVDGRLAAQSTP